MCVQAAVIEKILRWHSASDRDLNINVQYCIYAPRAKKKHMDKSQCAPVAGSSSNKNKYAAPGVINMQNERWLTRCGKFSCCCFCCRLFRLHFIYRHIVSARLRGNLLLLLLLLVVEVLLLVLMTLFICNQITNNFYSNIIWLCGQWCDAFVVD